MANLLLATVSFKPGEVSLIKLDMQHIVIVIHIQYKFHEIPFSGYLVMAQDGQMEGRTNMDKPISLRQNLYSSAFGEG